MIYEGRKQSLYKPFYFRINLYKLIVKYRSCLELTKINAFEKKSYVTTLSQIKRGASNKYIVNIFTQLNKSVAIHWKKKWSHFDLKSWVAGGTKIKPGILSNWWIFESNLLRVKLTIWLSISSQFDSKKSSSNFFVKVCPILRVNLTLNIESIWLSISSQFDSQCRVNLIQIFFNYSESWFEF